MAEIMYLYSPDTERVRSIDVVSRTPLMSGVDHLFRIQAQVSTVFRQRTVSFLERKPVSISLQDGDTLDEFTDVLDEDLSFNEIDEKLGRALENLDVARNHHAIWKRLKTSGFPVVNSVWLATKDTVVTSNPISEGTAIYDDSEVFLRRVEPGRTLPTDNTFSGINREVVIKDAQDLVKRATTLDISLSFSDPKLLVQPCGSYRIMLLDISSTGFDNPNNSKYMNEGTLNGFIENFDKLQQMVKGN